MNFEILPFVLKVFFSLWELKGVRWAYLPFFLFLILFLFLQRISDTNHLEQHLTSQVKG